MEPFISLAEKNKCTTSDIRCLDLLTVKLYLAVLESRDRVCVSEQFLKCETVQSSFVFCVWDCGLCIVCLRLWVGYCVFDIVGCVLCFVFETVGCGLCIVFETVGWAGSQAELAPWLEFAPPCLVLCYTLPRTVGQIKCHPHQYICATATLHPLCFFQLFPTLETTLEPPRPAPQWVQGAAC